MMEMGGKRSFYCKDEICTDYCKDEICTDKFHSQTINVRNSGNFFLVKYAAFSHGTKWYSFRLGLKKYLLVPYPG